MNIRWTDRQWDPLVGCTRKSAACKNCYAESLTAANSAAGQWGHGFATGDASAPTWTGKVELVADKLLLPLTWAEPCRIFVNSISDVFHEELTDLIIDRIFAVMALAPQHTFQILTKRPKVMKEYLTQEATVTRLNALLPELAMAANLTTVPKIETWPLPNVWLGVTAENQKEADRRIQLLLETPSAIRFIAAEPLLEQLDLKIGSWLRPPGSGTPRLDWVIAGGEVSKKAKPCQLDWVRSVRDQCAQTETAFFLNQWGEHVPSGSESADGIHRLDGEVYDRFPVA